MDVLEHAFLDEVHIAIVETVIDHRANSVERPLIPILAADGPRSAWGGEHSSRQLLLASVRNLR